MRSKSTRVKGYDLLKQMLADVATDNYPLPWDAYPCLEWPRSRSPRGYGKLDFDSRSWRVPRLAYVISVGPIPTDHQICHKCDNPPCFRPIHLFPGTGKDNMRDFYAKGRRIEFVRPSGSRSGKAKFTEETVLEIRQLLVEGHTHRVLAQKFGVVHHTIGSIARRRTWKHI